MKLKKIISAVSAIVMLITAIPSFAFIEANQQADYQWGHAKLGPGGFVTGLLFHPMEENLIYARTDVGGMYRWEQSTGEWKQLMKWSQEDGNLDAVDGFAIDPNDPDVVYAALGGYYWVAGGLYKSEDRGETWTKLVSARCNGNMLRRMHGECVAVDPANSDIIYFGTRYQGLYRSNDGGESWETINEIPFVNDTERAYGIRNIVVDTSGGTTEEGATAIVYAGSAGKGVYKSEDGGYSYTLMEGSPDDPYRMHVNSRGELFVSDDNGMFKFSNGQWTDISPVPGKIYQGMAVSPADPDTIMVSANCGDKMCMPVFTSYDGGKTWRNTFENVEFTERVTWFEDDNFSSNTCSVNIDPFNPQRVLISDWFGVWQTMDITEQPSVKWDQMVYGIEELCPFIGVCPPSGPAYMQLGVADDDGFTLYDVNEYPARKFTDRHLTYGAPRIQASTDVDICESDPNIVVRAGTGYPDEMASYSLDGGISWNAFETPPTEGATKNGCSLAVSCGKNEDTGYPTILFQQGGRQAKMSRDMGKTWTDLPFDNIRDGKWDRDYKKIVTDKVNPDKFYIYNNENVLHISDDGGKTWYKGAEVPDVAEKKFYHIRTAPGMEGEIWIGVGGKELYRSSDGGKTLTAVKNISDVQSFCFGMPMTGSEYPTAFVYGNLDGTRGVYRSTDLGESWVKINPDDFVLRSAVFMEGDRQTEGVVYFIHSGMGMFYLMPSGTVFKTGASETEAETVSTGAKISVEYTPMPNGSYEIKDNQMYVSLRKIFEMLGANVEWHERDASITVERSEYRVRIGGSVADGGVIDNKLLIDKDGNVFINGEEYILKNKMYLKNDTTYISVEDVAQLWNLKIKYDEKKELYSVSDTSFALTSVGF